MKEKDRIRKLIKEKRNCLSITERDIKDKNIFNRVVNSEIYKNSEVIFIYVSFNGEVDTLKIIEYSLNHNKIVCVPRVICNTKSMEAVKISSTYELAKGLYGILEPKKICKAIDKKDIDLVLIPGIAFDKKGNRLGYGGGFYDKFLEKKDLNFKFSTIGLAYEFQVVENIPCEKHDISVDGIITD